MSFRYFYSCNKKEPCVASARQRPSGPSSTTGSFSLQGLLTLCGRISSSAGIFSQSTELKAKLY